VLSPDIVTGLLRDRLGFPGVIITDDIEAGAVRAVAPSSTAAVSAAKAGVDIVLLARSAGASEPAFQALMAAARSGDLDRGALEESYARIEELQRSYAR
jgi:beta-N-acetylhexosaminidase